MPKILANHSVKPVPAAKCWISRPTIPFAHGQTAANHKVTTTSVLTVALLIYCSRSCPRGLQMLVDRIGGKRMLRLDYGYNIKTKTIDFHWNQKGVAESFGISNHTPAGQMGEAIYKGARYFKWGGRVLLVAAAIADGYSVVTSDRPWRQLAIVTGGWTGAWAGCKAFGAIGAAIGTAAEPGGGTAIGGAVGCFAGSLGGYWAGKTLVTMAVDNKAAENVGRAVEELLAPPSSNVDVSSSDNACWNPPPVCSPSVGVYTP